MDRLDAYNVLCSHYRRWLAHDVRDNLKFALTETDEQLREVSPELWRILAKELIEAADQADRECMAVWVVPEDKLNEFVRVRTHPELEGLMKEQYGKAWDDHFMVWTDE